MDISFEEFVNFRHLNKDPLESISHLLRQSRLPKAARNNWILAAKFNQDGEEKLYSDFTGILNKISKNNWKELAIEIKELNIDSDEHLIKLVELIFSKAISEPKFTNLYIKMSNELMDLDNFKSHLLRKCQNSFGCAIMMDKLIEETENSEFKFKEHITGCMVFIGELYNNGMLEDKIISSCLLRILMSINLKKAYAIDNLCSLIKVVGKKFSKNSLKDMNKYIEQVEDLIHSDIDIKDKFALMDIIDCKNKQGW